ncbi:alpha-1,2-Mannosidase [Operophtera brumata]|uniref:alpha-1,2-Mannosidase n=1 Tax=Operophtera brumata TaxID=104452 RepID=A0A0L7KVB0_OPEBR|nr:alpha-1,2-Mannosidase [Operophtera brumata]
MLFQVMQRHTFIPEAFTSDFQSTYYLHRATEDDHYLQVGKTVLKALQQHTRVPCGYAAVNDVRTRQHEDRMDSFVLAETFKYLYMMFSEDADLPIKLENYVLTTEAHFLPLWLANHGKNSTYYQLKIDDDDEDKYGKTCPNTASLVAEKVRQPMRELVGASAARPPARLRPMNDPRQVLALADMGISVITLPDGRVQLLYTTSTAKSAKDAAEGLTFMREMSKWNSMSDQENGVMPGGLLVGDRVLHAGPAHFGKELTGNVRFIGELAIVRPYDACTPVANGEQVKGKFGIAERGKCTFAQKVRNMQAAGVELAIVLDNIEDSSHENTAIFAMSGDGKDDITIPAVFLFSRESAYLFEQWKSSDELTVIIGELNSMKHEFETECAGNCEAASDMTAAASADKESFVHLKKILSQLVTQFELTGTNENSHTEKSCEETVPDAYLSQNRFINEKGAEGPIQKSSNVCAIKSDPSAPVATLVEKDSQTLEAEKQFDEA